MTLQQIRLVIAAAIACLVAAPFVLNPFSITLLNYIGIYALAAIGLALLTGVGGIVSFGQAAFVGVAAYSTAWVTAVNGYSPWLGLVLAVVLTCSIAAILGFVTLRLGGHYLAMVTNGRRRGEMFAAAATKERWLRFLLDEVVPAAIEWRDDKKRCGHGWINQLARMSRQKIASKYFKLRVYHEWQRKSYLRIG